MKQNISAQPVTKQELNVELNKLRKELKWDTSQLNRRINELDEKFDTKTQELKDYMYNLVDWVVSEIRTMQVEHTAQTHNIPAMRVEIEHLDDRVTKLELAMK